MIIDIHTHIGYDQQDFPDEWIKGTRMLARSRVMREIGMEAGLKDLSDPIFNPLMFTYSDTTGEKSYKTITQIGIDKCVLLPLDYNLMGLTRYHGTRSTFLPKRSIDELNKRVVDISMKYQDKYIAFCGIDPRRGREGLEFVRKAILEWGMKGIKLHPTAGYYPNDREVCYPLYELCMDLDIPILTHCGFESYGLPGKYADPIFWDDVANDFPGLRVCLGHGGGGFSHLLGRHYSDIGINLASYHENIYLDTASAEVMYRRNPVEFYRELRRMADWASWKIMWGTDGPWFGGVVSWEDYLNVFRRPDPKVLESAGVSFRKEELDMILGGNAKRFLKLH